MSRNIQGSGIHRILVARRGLGALASPPITPTVWCFRASTLSMDEPGGDLEPHRRIDRDQTTCIALDTSLLQEFFNQISSSATADVLPRIVGKMSAGNFRSDATRPSVDSATDNDTSRGDHSGSGHGTVCDDCAAGPYAACPVHTARAYNGACFHGAQGDEAAYQQ
jgi:hypothetical protein